MEFEKFKGGSSRAELFASAATNYKMWKLQEIKNNLFCGNKPELNVSFKDPKL